MNPPSLFSDYPISSSLQKAIQELGFQNPSPIQAEAIPLLLGEPTDLIGLAATGTGKTAAFSIPMLQGILDADLKPPGPTNANASLFGQKGVQSLVLCPTRELALQVSGQIDKLARHTSIKTVCIYGGTNYSDQIQGLKRGARIVVGTPGRILDHLRRGTLGLEDVRVVVLDEADEMISMGFKEDMEEILSSVDRAHSRTWLFSATMSPEIRKVAQNFLINPAQVQVNRKEMLPATVEQIFYATRESNKPDILCKIIEAADEFYGLIFCQTKSLVTDLTQVLIERGHKVDALHGDKDQAARERTMKAFRERKVSILICTDVASRGLDVSNITHVVNYSLPRELENYVHRIGRTGRQGQKGIAISLVTPSHRRLLTMIEQITKSRIKEGRIPTRKDLAIKKSEKVLKQFQETLAQLSSDSISTNTTTNANSNTSISSLLQRLGNSTESSWLSATENLSPKQITEAFLALIIPELKQFHLQQPQEELSERFHSQQDYSSPRWNHRSKSHRGNNNGHSFKGSSLKSRRDHKSSQGQSQYKKGKHKSGGYFGGQNQQDQTGSRRTGNGKTPHYFAAPSKRQKSHDNRHSKPNL